jgi:hypothetical protein
MMLIVNESRSIFRSMIHPLTNAWGHSSLIEEIKERVVLFEPEVSIDGD